MIERIIIIDKVDPVSFYGVNNANMHLIRNLFPKLRVAARGSVIKVIGEDAETSEFEEKIKQLEDYAEKYNTLPEDVDTGYNQGRGTQGYEARRRDNLRCQRQAHLGPHAQPTAAGRTIPQQRPYFSPLARPAPARLI